MDPQQHHSLCVDSIARRRGSSPGHEDPLPYYRESRCRPHARERRDRRPGGVPARGRHCHRCPDARVCELAAAYKGEGLRGVADWATAEVGGEVRPRSALYECLPLWVALTYDYLLIPTCSFSNCYAQTSCPSFLIVYACGIS